GRACGALGHGDRQLPRPHRRRARCAEDRRRARLQGPAARTRGFRQRQARARDLRRRREVRPRRRDRPDGRSRPLLHGRARPAARAGAEAAGACLHRRRFRGAHRRGGAGKAARCRAWSAGGAGMSEIDPILPELVSGRGTARAAGGGGVPLRQLPTAPATSPSKLGEDLKADFPGLLNADGTPWHYLDSAATAQKPQAVIDAVSQAIGTDYATVHRGVYSRSAEMTLGYEAARRRVAEFIGGREDEVVFTRGATEAINLVAYCWPGVVGSGARVLLSELEHHSNIVPWQLAGWQIDVCPLTPDGRIDLDAAERMLTPEHKMVAFGHVSNVLGSVLDARRAADIAHAVGARLLLDGCQAVPRLPVDVAALDCDFYAFSGHKLYGPTGIGALWGRHELLDAMPPWQGGGAMIEKVTFARTTYAPPPQRFEAGTPAIVEAIGLAVACDYVAGI